MFQYNYFLLNPSYFYWRIFVVHGNGFYKDFIVGIYSPHIICLHFETLYMSRSM